MSPVISHHDTLMAVWRMLRDGGKLEQYFEIADTMRNLWKSQNSVLPRPDK